MKKKIVQDVLPPKKTIRSVELTDRTRHLESKKSEEAYFGATDNSPPLKIEKSVEKSSNFSSEPQYSYEYKDRNRSKLKVYVSLLLLVFAFAFAISAFFKSAVIRVTPQKVTKSINEVLTAKKESALGVLSFQAVSVSKDVDMPVAKSDIGGDEKIERKANGRIIIYNNYSSESQKLVATTRFQTPEGLVFRIAEPVTIPGKITKDGKTIPGSIEVYVEADKPGTAYNVGLKDFSVPGFAGDPRFKEVYARSKTEMSGGFSGLQKAVIKESLSKYESEMQNELKSSLFSDLSNQIPEEYVLFQGSLSYKFDPIVQSVTSNGDIFLKMKGVANAVIFKKADVAMSLKEKVLPEAQGSDVKITNFSDLQFSYSSTSTLPTGTSSSVTFSLAGEPTFVWIIDENKLKSELLGLSKSGAKDILANYSSIKEAVIVTRPFWARKIPNDVDKVKFIEETQ
jgi:hypothetical protein